MKKPSIIYAVGMLCFFATGITGGYLWGNQVKGVSDDETRQYEEQVVRKAPVMAKKRNKSNEGEIITELSSVKEYSDLLKYAKYREKEWEKMSSHSLREEYKNYDEGEDAKWKTYNLKYILFRKWGELYPEEAMDFAVEQGEKGVREKNDLLNILAGQSPEKVFDYITANKGQSYHFSVLNQVFRNWANIDDKMAWDKLKSMTLLEQKAVLPNFLDGVRENNHGKLKQYMEEIDWETMKEVLPEGGREVNRAIAASGIDLNVLGDSGEWKNKITRMRLERLGAENFPAFEERFSELSREDKEKFFTDWEGSRIIDGVDPDKLLAFFEKETQSGVNMKVGVEKLFENWPNWDREGMLQTIEKMPEGESKQRAKVIYAQKLPYLDHQKNVELIKNLQLTNKNEEKNLLIRACREWYNDSPEEAETAMNRFNFTEGDKEFVKRQYGGYQSHIFYSGVYWRESDY